MSPFKSNAPKDLLRSTFDHDFIRGRLGAGPTERAYLGLPGEALLDVLEWRDVIDRAACIHRKAEGIDLMRGAAADARADAMCEFYRGDIDVILSTGRDEDDQYLADRPYRIVNLDYESGLIQDPTASRLEAIRALFEMQAQHEVDFVMFLTLGPRGRPDAFPTRGLDQIGRTLKGYRIDATETIKWYRKQPDNFHIWKVFVPYAIERRANAFRYELNAWTAFFYIGSGDTPMMHFAMLFRFARSDLVPDPLNLAELLTSRLNRVTDRILPDPVRPPPLTYP
jgi:hypothetical protein